MTKPEDEKSIRDLNAAELIARFNDENKALRDPGEEMANLSRLAKSLVGTDSLSVDTLTTLFKRAHESLPLGATFLISYRVIEEATTSGKFTGKTLKVVHDSIMADEDPMWTSLEEREKHNKKTWGMIMMNTVLFELMVPYM